jgi:hypothetical protein
MVTPLLNVIQSNPSCKQNIQKSMRHTKITQEEIYGTTLMSMY